MANDLRPHATCTAVLSLATALLAGRAALADPPPRQLTMQWVVSTLRVRHPALAAARERVRAADTGAAQALNLPDPMFMTEAQPAYRFGEGVGMLMYSLQQTIPLGPERGLNARAARSDARASRIDVETTGLDLELAAKLAFVRLSEAEAVRRTREEELALAASTAEVVRARVSVGATPPSNAINATFQVTEAEIALEAARGEEQAARTALLALLGLPPDTDVGLAQPLAVVAEPPPLTALFDAARQSRPELRAYAARATAAERRGAAIEARSWPMMTVGAGYIQDFAMMPAEGGGTESASDGIMAMAGISLPVWESPRRAAAAEQRANARAMRADAATVLRAAETEIASLRAGIVSARARAAIIHDRLIPQANAHHELASVEYVRAQTDFFDLQQAVEHHISSLLDEVRVIAEAARLEAMLERAIGTELTQRQGERR